MTKLESLKSAKSLRDVARLLGFKAHTLSFILYIKPGAEKYREFEIPKRSGGTRSICAPTRELKHLQKNLSILLQDCVDEINASLQRLDQMAHGFKRKRSIYSNAKRHRNRRYVFNADLTDFFGSINFGRVRGYFIKNKTFELNPVVATIIAQIACHRNALPQGSPCSPVISNLISQTLDMRLTKLASDCGCRYSRYADDLTFSTNKQEIPIQISKFLDTTLQWAPGKKLQSLVESCGFSINEDKTRLQFRDSRQEVTGLIVNKKVNVRREYRHNVRAMVHNVLHTGKFYFPTRSTEDDSTSELKAEGRLSQLHGMLAFIYRIDQENVKALPKGSARKQSEEELEKKEKLYRKFLFFKEFYAAPIPVIICEGKTDHIYISFAIKRLAHTFPTLAKVDAHQNVKLSVRLFRHSGTNTAHIIGLKDGGSTLANVLRSYCTESRKIKAPGGQNCVIFLVDNDEGSRQKNGIFKVVQDFTGERMTGDEPFVHVATNAYVVPVPQIAGSQDTTIEDLFDDEIKAISLGGKTFSTGNNLDPSLHYGKHVFAERVIKPNARSINFDKFNMLLSNIVGAIAAQAARRPSASPNDL